MRERVAVVVCVLVLIISRLRTHCRNGYAAAALFWAVQCWRGGCGLRVEQMTVLSAHSRSSREVYVE